MESDNRPVLGQRFEDALQGRWKSKRDRLPAFFSNLIPESNGALAQLIRKRLGLPEGDEVALLECLGGDLPGAVTVLPIDAAPPSPTGPERGLSDDEDSDGMAPTRFSLGGVQLKFSMSFEGDRLTLPATGVGGDWILKIPGHGFSGLSENEWSIMRWARVAGFDVPECRLIHRQQVHGLRAQLIPGDVVLFAIKRYDRDGPDRIHQEDFAQVSGLLPERKYEHVTYEGIGRVVRSLMGEAGAVEFVKRSSISQSD